MSWVRSTFHCSTRYLSRWQNIKQCWSCTSRWCALMWNTVHQCSQLAIKKTSYWLKECSTNSQGWFLGSLSLNCHIVKDWNTWGSGVWKKDKNRADIIEVFKMAKGWSAIPLESTFELSMTKHLRGYNFKLVKHRSNLELRRNFFTERLINRWNSLDQQSLDVDSVNCFKNHLQWLRQCCLS